MSPNEEIIVRQFVVKERRDRWRFVLNDSKRQGAVLHDLNPWRDLDPACATWMKRRSTTDIIALLKAEGSAASVYVMAADDGLDGQTLPMSDAVQAVFRTGWPAILLCTPTGTLGYYYGEEGMTRALLKRPGSK